MSTPAFIPTRDSLTDIRFYTALDPYFYTVDNRPIIDLDDNIEALSAATDAFGAASLLNSLYTSGTYNRLERGTSVLSKGVRGLETSVNLGNLTILPGSFFVETDLTSSDSRQIVKQYILPFEAILAINTVSLTGSQSVIYTVEMKPTDLDGSTLGFPFFDPDNTSSPQLALFGELQLQIVAGSPATTGLQVAPAETGGDWITLYQVTVDGATGNVVNIQHKYFLEYAINGMEGKSLTLIAGSATNTTVGTLPVFAFANASTTNAFSYVDLIGGAFMQFNINPYAPISFLIKYTQSVSNNAFAVRFKYAFLAAGDSVSSISYTNTATEVINAGGVGELMATVLEDIYIPTYAGMLQTSYLLALTIERLGADGADTNTGILNLISVQAYQTPFVA